MTFEVSSRSVSGSSHEYEDRILVDGEMDLYAVADGVTNSSQGSGGVATERAIALLKESFAGDLTAAVGAVHMSLLALKKVDETVGETTITAAYLGGGRAEVVNVGDSPGCLIREGDLRFITRADRNELGYITQVIGYPERITVHRNNLALRRGDYLVLASDGVAHVLNQETILPIAVAAKGPGDLVEAIIERARAWFTGYDDDKSVIAIKVLGGVSSKKG